MAVAVAEAILAIEAVEDKRIVDVSGFDVMVAVRLLIRLDAVVMMASVAASVVGGNPGGGSMRLRPNVPKR